MVPIKNKNVGPGHHRVYVLHPGAEINRQRKQLGENLLGNDQR